MAKCVNKGCGCKGRNNYEIADPCNPTPCEDGELCAEKFSAECIVMSGDYMVYTGPDTAEIVHNPSVQQVIDYMYNNLINGN